MLQNKKLCRGISFVDTPSLIADESKIASPNENMLAYKVNSENRFARLYLNALLYDIHCCESYDDIEKYRKSIIPDYIRHMYYRTEFVSNTELYIGINARKLHLDKAKKEQQKLLKSEKKYKEKIDNIRKAVDNYNAVINDNTFDALCKYCSAFSKPEKIYDEYTVVCNKLEELKANPILQVLFSLVEKCQNDLKEIENKIGEVNRNIGVSKNAIENAEVKKGILQRESLEAEEAFDSFCDEFPMLVEAVRSKYNENIRLKAAKEIVKNQRDYHLQLEKALTKIINEELIPLQRQYNSTYTTDFSEGLDSFSSFDALYNTLVNIELKKILKVSELQKKDAKNALMIKFYSDLKTIFTMPGNNSESLTLYYPNLITARKNTFLKWTGQATPNLVFFMM